MATLTIRNGLYVWAGTFAERIAPKEAGFRWHPDLKRWETRLPEKAYKLLNYADPETRAQLESVMALREQAMAASAAVSADLHVPTPAGRRYYGYQVAGVAYAAEREATFIADEMGLGKTIQAIGLINFDPTLCRVLIVCPAFLKINWERELRSWLTRPMTIGIATGKSWPQTDIVIINYEVLSKRPEIHAEEWDLAVLDESHYIKNDSAARTKQVVGHKPKRGAETPAIRARKRLAMTGTPILNRPVELFTTLNWLDRRTWGSFWGFAKTYCAAHHDGYGWNFSGASNLEQLQEKLRTSVMVRRLKADVLTELPPKRRQIVELQPKMSSGQRKEQEELLNELQARQESARALVELAEAAGDEDAYQAAVERLTDEAQIAFEDMSRVRKELGLLKVTDCAEFIVGALESSPKIVVFAHHREVIASLQAALQTYNPVVVTGETPMEKRQEAVDRFQTDPSCRVFVGNIKAAGVGITLTAASHVVFVELDFVPGWISQAEDRCHRIGQTDSVLVQHLVVDETVDAWLAKMLVAKQNVADRGLNGGSLLAVETLEFDFPEPKAPAAPADISRVQIQAVHNNLRMLAGVCDGAAEKDDMGFNGLDAPFGHNLAAQASLSAKQAIAARKMIKKYHRQLGSDRVQAMFQ